MRPWFSLGTICARAFSKASIPSGSSSMWKGRRTKWWAPRWDILNQYLVESAVLAGAGGLAGVWIAWVLAVAVRTFSSVPMSLPWSSVFTGVGLSAAVGLFFGIYPARRASKLDPIEALRVER